MYRRTASSLFLSGMAAYALTATTLGVVYVLSVMRSPGVPVGVVSPATPEPSSSRFSVGLVSLGEGVADDSRATAVASTFNTYFGGINTKKYDRAVAMYDPGFLDARRPRAVRQFTHEVSTSVDDQVTMVALYADPSGRTSVEARMKFRSRQAPGFGPRGNAAETCTRWDVTYLLTERSAAAYRIAGSKDAQHRSC